MKSKLDPNKFPLADPNEWLIFSKSWQRNIDYVFACRLAALAKQMNNEIHISSGYRNMEEQVRAYKKSGGRLVNGVWTGGSGYAAKPGSSWHQFRLAIDTSDAWLKALEKDLATADQATFMRFGLFKPLTKGNKTSVREDWHIQPIETVGVKDKNSLLSNANNHLQRGMTGIEVQELQQILVRGGCRIGVNGIYDEATERAVKDFQRARKIADSGVTDSQTWEELYKS